MHDDRERTVRERAFSIWEEEGRPEGRHDDHWRRAQRELAGIDVDEMFDERRDLDAHGATGSNGTPRVRGNL